MRNNRIKESKIGIRSIHGNVYTVSKTDLNISLLVNANYTKPEMVVLEDTSGELTAIKTTDIEGFYTMTRAETDDVDWE